MIIVFFGALRLIVLLQPTCIEMEDVFESSRHAFIAMELLNGGDFFDRIVDKKRNGHGLGESLSKFYCYQMLKAIQVILTRSN
jgi:serine/threonine protein kinase